MQLKKIKVYGKLRQFLGTSYFEAAVSSPAEAVRFLICNYPELEPHLQQNMYRICVNNDILINQEDLLVKSEGEIKIIPIVSGAWFFLAAAFIGAGAATAGVTAGFFATKFGIALSTGLLTTGVTMAITGVTNMLFPVQQPEVGDISSGLSETDARVNYSFSGIQNVSRSGVCMPLIFGEVFCGSIVVSSGTDTAPVFKS